MRVIQEKKDRFALRTLVQVIWACARIDFTNSNFEMIPLFQEFAKYERLQAGLPTMYQKSQAILLWTYTRDDRLLEDEVCQLFIHKILDAMLMHQSQKFELDNFDLTLVIQSITNVRNAGNQAYMQKMFRLAHQCDALALANVYKMSIHEFVTICQFYLSNYQIMSKPLMVTLLDKMQTCV